MTSDESGCFDPNRTLIVALNGRTVVDVLSKFEKLGNIESFQHLDDSDSLLLMYDTSNNELRNIIADVKGEDVTPLSEVRYITRYVTIKITRALDYRYKISKFECTWIGEKFLDFSSSLST